jgi:hypothetical protein
MNKVKKLIAEVALAQPTKRTDLMGIKKVTFDKPQRKTNSHNYVTLYEVGRHLGVPKGRIQRALVKYGPDGFTKIPEFEPFAHLFEQYQRTNNDQRRAFGIKKIYWQHYLRYGKIPERLGAKPLDPFDPDSYRVKCLRFKAPPFYGRFKAGIARANYNSIEKMTLEQAVHLALEEFMNRRPEYFFPEKSGDKRGRKTKI